MSVSVSVLTLNLRNVLDRYEERRPLLTREFGRIGPDLAGLQEVAYLDEPQDALLASAVAGRAYRLFDARSRRFPDFGNALLVGTGNAETSDELRLTNGRCALRVLVLLPGNLTAWMVTTHLHHVPAEPDERARQASDIVDWMEAAPRADAVLVTGDFNAPPSEPTYGLMRAAGYRSAFAEVHGSEPAVTWPSGIQADGMDTDGDPACLDYVWIRGDVVASSAALAFDEHAPGDPTLFPSDHFGVLARLDIGTGRRATRP